jgi:hypothetical protein
MRTNESMLSGSKSRAARDYGLSSDYRPLECVADGYHVQ